MSIVVNASLNTDQMKKGADDAEKQVDRIIDSVAELDKKQERYEATEKRRREKAAREQRKAEQEAAKAAEAARIKAEKEAARAAKAAEKAAEKQINANKAVTTNLVSQFNDIGVMLAAGQNPLQLAMQQGTQVSAALQGLQGGVGPLRALGEAFKGFVTPMSLATLGKFIGVGAALANYIIPKIGDLIPKTKTAQERTEELKTSTDNYIDSLERAKTPLTDMIQKYGHLAGAIKRADDAQVDANKSFVERDLKQQAAALAKQFPADTSLIKKADPNNPVAFLSIKDGGQPDGLYKQQEDIKKIQTEYGATREQAIALSEAIHALNFSLQNGNYYDASLILANLTEINSEVAKNANLKDTQIEKQNELNATIETSRKAVDALYTTEDKLVENAAKAQIKRIEEIGELRKQKAEAQEKLDKARERGDEVATQKAILNMRIIDSKIKETGETFTTELTKWGDKFIDLKIQGVEFLDTLIGKAAEFGVSLDNVSADNLSSGGDLLTNAQQYLGLHEIEDRETIKGFIGADPLTNAWCAMFVNTLLEQMGLQGTGSAAAISFKDYGTETRDPKPGDIVVLKSGDSPSGNHVGIYAGESDNGKISVLGGNQGDSVKYSNFSKDSVITYRRIGNSTKDNAVTQEEIQNALANSEAEQREKTAQENAKKIADERERAAKAAEKEHEKRVEISEDMARQLGIAQSTNKLDEERYNKIKAINDNNKLSDVEKAKEIATVNAEYEKQLFILREIAKLKDKDIDPNSMMEGSNMTYMQNIMERADIVSQDSLLKSAEGVDNLTNKMKGLAAVSEPIKSAFSSIFDGIVQGTMTAKDALKTLISAIGKNLINNIGIWATGGAQAGAGLGQWLLGSIGGAAAGSFSAHKDGGIVNSSLQLVGERGSELVSLPRGSRVHTAQQTSRMLQGASQGQNITLQIVSDGSFKSEILNESAKNTVRIVDKNLKVYDKASNNRIRDYQRNPYKA